MCPAVRPERTAVLVARAWSHGEPATLVARITCTVDVSLPERVVIEAVGEEEIVAAVRAWLADLERALRAGDGPVTDP
jgi:hypothetical protein